MTCWRRLHEWQEAGVWRRLHEALLARLNEANRMTGLAQLSIPRICPQLWGLENRAEPGQQA